MALSLCKSTNPNMHSEPKVSHLSQVWGDYKCLLFLLIGCWLPSAIWGPTSYEGMSSLTGVFLI